MRMSFGSGLLADLGRFNWASRKLNKRLLQLGAGEIYPCGEADQQHSEGFVFLAVVILRLMLTCIGLKVPLFRG